MDEFFKATKGCVAVRLREPANKFLPEFKQMMYKTFDMITQDDTIKIINTAMEDFEKEDEKNKSILSLIKLELSSFVKGYRNTTGATKDNLEDPPSMNAWFSKKVTAKDMLKAAKTILESLMDALEDLLPKWVKALLNTLKEVFGFAIG
jgi:hypothetical protein